MKQNINKISILKHSNNIRVYYEDTDAGGLVYHANYLKFAERARTEMLREVKIEQLNLKNDYNIQFIVKNLYIDFFKPAQLDDLLTIKSVILKVSLAKVIMEQLIYKKMTLLAKIDVTLGSINTEGKPSRLPKIVLEKLNNNINTKEQ